jgi:hypothetical protein
VGYLFLVKTVAMLIVLLTQMALGAMVGQAVWRDQGWNPRWGLALGLTLGFGAVMIVWLIVHRRDLRGERSGGGPREGARRGGAGTPDRDGAGPVAT